MHILFVCTGNICHSPTAERLTLAHAAEDGLEITAASAGTRGLTGHPMEPTAAQILVQLGGSPDGFVARRLTPVLAEQADLVLAMTVRHRDAILAQAPRQLRRTFTLLEASSLILASGASTVAEMAEARPMHTVDATDVADPYTQPVEVFEKIGQQIADALPPILSLR